MRFSVHTMPKAASFILGTGALLSVTTAAVFCAAKVNAGELARVSGMHRLSEAQYRQTIADIFGDEIKLGGEFEPEVRTAGLLAVGEGQATISSAGLEAYDAMAQSLASEVLDEKHRASFMPCAPKSVVDSKCAQQFIMEVGAKLYKRPVDQTTMQQLVKIADESAAKTQDFYTGLENSLATMLVDPNFLFRIEYATPASGKSGLEQLDGYSKASRLSYWLWDTEPDQQLFKAAAKGQLDTKAGLAAQVDRMLASPQLERGVRAFFSDMLGFDEFRTASKDAGLLPKYRTEIAAQAQEQTLRTIVELLVTQNGDYRDLFTTRKTFLTRQLAAVYNVPLVVSKENGAPEVWAEYVYPDGDPRAGLLSQVSFTALHSHSGRSSPTLRGKALRELLLCQPVPPPPANVDFSLVNNEEAAAKRNLVTLRDRLTAHATQPICAGCHKIVDPLGLTLENFDASGSYRLTDHGATIDSSGNYKGQKITNALDLGAAVAKDPAAANCLASRAYAYALGAAPSKDAQPVIESLQRSFAQDGYRLAPLLREIALSDGFFASGAVEPSKEPDVKAADASALKSGRIQ
jgi:hypothetical protein